jgi:hypothetical protein
MIEKKWKVKGMNVKNKNILILDYRYFIGTLIGISFLMILASFILN